ncbi:MAG TPA: ribonuclease P protein component [Hyphomicrobiaceae bacterium]|jgi:ribonuclease P protein component|nr:ribonuclease P protein component [Hyphomicrobiaceae bacterium]
MPTIQAQGHSSPRRLLSTLKRHAEFQRVRKGSRWATLAFVLEARPRDGTQQQPVADAPRFGFTVTKKTGGAVERNRIRRRLRAAVRHLQKDHARPDFDYVLIARRPALDLAYATLVAELEKAFSKVHRPAGRTHRHSNRPPAR